MTILILRVKKQYFDEIKEGTKIEEYREVKPYWKARIENKKFDFVEIVHGYGGERIRFPWNGYTIKTITHPIFGNIPTEVYAIKLVKTNE
jgi:hypothetical protein